MSQTAVDEDTWQNFGLRLVVNTAGHPIDYAKVLMQIGYEPLPAYPSTSIFGRPTYYLPNVFQYVAYIKSVDGVSGCFRGLTPKLCSNIVSTITFHKVSATVGTTNPPEKAFEDMTDEEQFALFVRNLARDVCARAAAVAASQPFNVIAVRMMAQFVGGETKYSGIFASVGEIYQTNGLAGFFSGLTPRLIGELVALILAGTLTYTVNKCIVQDRELRTYTSAVMSYIASALTYPFLVVANTMAVNGSGLIAGMPPHMPIYAGWTDCWKQLTKTNQLKRGSSLVFRAYASQLPFAKVEKSSQTVEQMPVDTILPFFRFDKKL